MCVTVSMCWPLNAVPLCFDCLTCGAGSALVRYLCRLS
jgi:hypothetical protein